MKAVVSLSPNGREEYLERLSSSIEGVWFVSVVSLAEEEEEDIVAVLEGTETTATCPS